MNHEKRSLPKEVRVPIEEPSDERYRYCLSDETEGLLDSICQCKGGLVKIHLDCLKEWINRRVKKEVGRRVTIYKNSKC